MQLSLNEEKAKGASWKDSKVMRIPGPLVSRVAKMIFDYQLQKETQKLQERQQEAEASA